MEAITSILTKTVADAFEKCGYDGSNVTVTTSDRLDLCQFQSNSAFAASKRAKKPPFVVAEEVSKALGENPIFEKAEFAKPGFINLTLTDEYLVAHTNKIISDEHMGIVQAERPDKIILDYGGPNVAKPLHVGHLRPAIIGEAIKRIAIACGHTVIGDIHLGDWGLQIGLVIAELSERYPTYACFTDDFTGDKSEVPEITPEELTEVYPFASNRAKEDREFSLKARVATAELQKGREGYIALWKKIMKVSLKEMRREYDKLNVHFDLWYGESDAEPYVPELLKILTEKGLLRESEGAMVVDVQEETDKAPMPPVIIKKSDDSNIYATTDLATILQRYHKFAPDKMWYVTDKRQELHFTQVFRCAKKAQLVPDEVEFGHFGFGTMNGKDGKPYKTRDGGVMRLGDFIKTVIDGALEKMTESDYVSDEDMEENARRIGVAAIKFGDLINHRAKDYIFDIDKFLSFEGKTGTYILYTVTRINSILKKLGIDPSESRALNGIYTEAERELLLKLSLTTNVFARSLSEKAPNYICENLFDIASLFSTFYHDSRIIDEPDEEKKSSWIALMLLTRKFLCHSLDALGIETVESM
ncbi:MAG: arginine--tRNA ligase [Clostridiales bacterium]|nr:arginine--tRNA ligase [Clostridiales bacterium]